MERGQLKLLLIEDDEEDYIITRDLLAEIKRGRYELAWLADYEQSRQALARNEHDIYLVDYRLGVENGLNLLREAIARGCTSPIILLTGVGDERIDIEAMNAGAADYLIKGQMTPSLLERSLDHALRRKKIEQRLRESEEQYRLLFDENPHPMWVVSAETLAILAVNGAAIGHYGYSKDEFQRMTFLQLLSPENKPLEGSLATGPRALPPQHPALAGGWRHRRKGGSLIDVEITSNQITFAGQQASLILASDITQRRVLEAQLRQSQKMESLGTLAGGIAHDFNNILCIILGNSATLADVRLEPEKFRKSIHAIERAVHRGSGLVRQILTFARRTEVVLGPLNVNSGVEELVKMLASTFPKTIDFRCDLDPNLPFIVGDPNQLHQSLLNLCLNARDAMPHGGEISLQTKLVAGASLPPVLHEAQDGSYVRVSVSDTGAGMDERTRSRIFEPFFTTKPRDQGTGLGLAVVYGVVKTHGGFIQTESEVGRGTTFRIYLPVQTPATPDPSATPETGASAVPGGSETLLLVEDEEPLLVPLEFVLTEKGYRVLSARDGLEAVEVFAKHQDQIALVVTDMGLPKLSGPEALERMRAINPRIKALLVSGSLDPEALAKSGANDFLQKPYRPEELSRHIRRVLDTV